VRITSKGQVTIPQHIREKAGLLPNTEVQFEYVRGDAILKPLGKPKSKGWARSHDLVFIPEYEIETKAKERRYVDGALLYESIKPCRAKTQSSR